MSDPAQAGAAGQGRFGDLPRVALHFCLLYTALGAILPYIPVWLREAKGLEASQIGIILAGISFSRVIAGPLLAAWSEGLRFNRTQMVVLAFAGLAAFIVYGLAGPVWLVMGVGILAGLLFQSQAPLGEMAALRVTDGASRFHYGHIRALASFFFILANLGAGALIEALGIWAGYGWIVAAITLTCLAALWLPPWPRPAATRAAETPFFRRLRDSSSVLAMPGLLRIVVAAALIQAAHGFYYGFASNLWIDQGIAEAAVGGLWAVGVVAEIAFLVLIAPRLDRVNPALLLVLGGLASLVRWGLYALAPPIWMVIPLQTLHLATFGLTLIGTMRFLQNTVPQHRMGAAQHLVSALVMAPLMGVVTLASGYAAEAFGVRGYGLALIVALAGLLVAVTGLKIGARSLQAVTASPRPVDPDPSGTFPTG